MIAFVALLGAMMMLAGAAATGNLTPYSGPGASAAPTIVGSPAAPLAVVMPDLIALPAAEAGERLGALGLSSSWGRPVIVRCEARPRTVVTQRPQPGTLVGPGALVQVRTAALDLDAFRGPCGPAGGELGPDAALARRFYRFAADPSLGAPFTSGGVRVGIESGLASITLDEAAQHNLVAWEIETAYAEATGPFSALDTLASSGGYYELRQGVAASCGSGERPVPPELIDLRAISLTAPSDVTSACIEWWAVTLFLDHRDRISAVTLRLGSP